METCSCRSHLNSTYRPWFDLLFRRNLNTVSLGSFFPTHNHWKMVALIMAEYNLGLALTERHGHHFFLWGSHRFGTIHQHPSWCRWCCWQWCQTYPSLSWLCKEADYLCIVARACTFHRWNFWRNSLRNWLSSNRWFPLRSRWCHSSSRRRKSLISHMDRSRGQRRRSL